MGIKEHGDFCPVVFLYQDKTCYIRQKLLLQSIPERSNVWSKFKEKHILMH